MRFGSNNFTKKTNSNNDINDYYVKLEKSSESFDTFLEKFSWKNLQILIGLGPDATTDTSGIMEARLQPWLGECLKGLNGGVRRSENECILGLFNLTTQGVLSADKMHFALQQLTALSHSHPRSFLAVVVMPNRAGDISKSSPTKFQTQSSVRYSKSNQCWLTMLQWSFKSSSIWCTLTWKNQQICPYFKVRSQSWRHRRWWCRGRQWW